MRSLSLGRRLKSLAPGLSVLATLLCGALGTWPRKTLGSQPSDISCA